MTSPSPSRTCSTRLRRLKSSTRGTRSEAIGLLLRPPCRRRLWSLAIVNPGTELVVRIGGSDPVQLVRERNLVLGPDVRYIGWIGEPTPTQELFETVPEIEAIYAWDGTSRRWMTASRNDEAGLRAVHPGMGLRLQLSAGAALDWERPLVPARGLVELSAGENLVAWAGPDETPITDVVKGIGSSLVQARRWNNPEQRFDVYSPLDATTAEQFPLVARGDALWVTVSRRTNWLQPANLLPEIRVLGSASKSLEIRVTEAVVAAFDHFAAEFGLQPDMSNTEYLIPSSANATVRYLKNTEVGCDENCDNTIRSLWDTSAGWADIGWIVAKPGEFGCNRCGYPLTTHEFFHVIQRQLAERDNHIAWLLEGTADWALLKQEAKPAWRPSYSGAVVRSRGRVAKGPTLQNTEAQNRTFEYALGFIATDLLVEKAGEDSILEFYRSLVPINAGPTDRWRLYPHWADVFEMTFGVAVDEFYAEFDAMQSNLPNRRVPGPESFERTLSGKLLRQDGTAVVGVEVTAAPTKNGINAGIPARGVTEADGGFELFVQPNTKYRLYIAFADLWACNLAWTGDAWSSELSEPRIVQVRSNSPLPLTITVPDHLCRWQLTGRLVDSDRVAIVGAQVQVSGSSGWYNTVTRSDGRFNLVVPGPDTFRLTTDLGGCLLRWNRSGARATNVGGHFGVTVKDADLDFGTLEIPSYACAWQIGGHLLDANGDPIKGTRVYADGDSGSANALSEAEGAFSMTVSVGGSYRLRVSIDNCVVYYRDGGDATTRVRPTTITVDGQDEADLRFMLPSNACSLMISGRLQSADGEPIGDTRVYVRTEDGSSSSSQALSDGSFAITVPGAGTYRLSMRIDGCTVYYKRDVATGSYSQAARIQVSDSDVTGIQVQLVEGLCELRMSGTLLNDDRTARSGVWVSASGASGNGGAQSGSDGSFSFAVPASDSYRVSVWIDGCSIYRGSRGPTTELEQRQHDSRVQCRRNRHRVPSARRIRQPSATRVGAPVQRAVRSARQLP